MAIGRPPSPADEDLTDELSKRLFKRKLKFTLIAPLVAADKHKAKTMKLALPWTQELEQAAFDRKRSGLSCLLLEDGFNRIITQIDGEFAGKKIAVDTLRPDERANSGNALKDSRAARRLVLRYVDYGTGAL